MWQADVLFSNDHNMNKVESGHNCENILTIRQAFSRGYQNFAAGVSFSHPGVAEALSVHITQFVEDGVVDTLRSEVLSDVCVSAETILVHLFQIPNPLFYVPKNSFYTPKNSQCSHSIYPGIV